jgi:hypothetical protein
MARNPVKRTAGAEDGDDLDEGQKAPEAGGTPGVPETNSGAQLHPSNVVTQAQDKIVRDVRDPASEAAPPPKKYEVVGGPYTVQYQNFPYKLNPGKLLSEHTHDIPKLRAMGVRMVEVKLDDVGA